MFWVWISALVSQNVETIEQSDRSKNHIPNDNI